MTGQTEFELYGTRSPEYPGRLLRAGALSAVLLDGNLRTIRYHGHEVLRAIAFLVRDKDWGTCAPCLSDLLVDEEEHRFAIRYTARFTSPSGATLACNAAISGDASGALSFQAEFRADAPFETARAGFTVLHPLKGVVGEPVEVTHGDRRINWTHWPDLIEPWQPFLDIRQIRHGVAPGVFATTRLEGDTFEMEDQRNWTDGSYKTYVRPLALPWPYAITPGEPVFQRVSLAIEAHAATPHIARAAAPVSLLFAPTQTRLPNIGLGLRPDDLDQERAALPRLAEICPQELIAHFDPQAGHGAIALAGFARIAAESGLPLTLELALPCRSSPDAELAAIAGLCADADLTPATLFVSPAVDRQSTPPGSRWPDCPPLDEVYAAARKAFPSTRLGGGMMSYFTELNRKRVPASGLDYISHCTNPIVHAADDLSVMQSFEALEDVVRSVRALYPTLAYRIGPSTIAMRQNPYGAATKDNPDLRRIPMANVDPRHNAAFGAAWTLAYAATAAPAGLEMLTLSTLAGPYGLIAGAGEPRPEGSFRPLAAVIATLARLSGQPLVQVTSSAPDAIRGLATEHALLLANMTARAQALHVPEGWRRGVALAGPDIELRAGDPVALAPYQVVELTR